MAHRDRVLAGKAECCWSRAVSVTCTAFRRPLKLRFSAVFLLCSLMGGSLCQPYMVSGVTQSACLLMLCKMKSEV